MTVELKIHSETYAYFEEKAPVLFFILSREGKIVNANRYAQDLTGRSLSGENFRDVIVDFTGKFDLTDAMQRPVHGTTHQYRQRLRSAPELLFHVQTGGRRLHPGLRSAGCSKSWKRCEKRSCP